MASRSRSRGPQTAAALGRVRLAREPTLLYLVFETGGHVYAYETLEEAGGSIEATDLNEGHYIGAFSDQGEVIAMSPGGLWVKFSPSGTVDSDALRTLIRGSRSFSEFAADPHRSRSRSGTPSEGVTTLGPLHSRRA